MLGPYHCIVCFYYTKQTAPEADHFGNMNIVMFYISNTDGYKTNKSSGKYFEKYGRYVHEE